MAMTIESTTTEVLDLSTFIEDVDRRLNPEDDDSLAACASQLKALANNRKFITEELNHQLSGWHRFQSTNSYTAQTMMLGGRKNFQVRANIWTPPSSQPELRAAEEQLFFYKVPHDHNFSFLTVGYFGSGYSTLIYEYDPSVISGTVGERAGLRFLEKTTLPEGKIMLYRASRDVHSQEDTCDFSVSLNLMVPAVTRSQFFFDLEKDTVSGIVPTANTTLPMICQLALHLGDGRSVELLDGLANSHGCERMRAACYETLTKLEPASTERLWERAASDRHPFVKRIAREVLAKYGN